jgi:hypothetical protein
MDKTPRERAERGILLLSNGYIGEKTGPASRDPEVMSVFFDQVRRGADPTQVPSGTTIQWDFIDAPPWLLTVDGAGAQIEQRRADEPTLTLKMAYQDFIDLSAGRVDPRRLVLTRRLRPRGDLRMLLRLPRLFP